MCTKVSSPGFAGFAGFFAGFEGFFPGLEGFFGGFLLASTRTARRHATRRRARRRRMLAMMRRQPATDWDHVLSLDKNLAIYFQPHLRFLLLWYGML